MTTTDTTTHQAVHYLGEGLLPPHETTERSGLRMTPVVGDITCEECKTYFPAPATPTPIRRRFTPRITESKAKPINLGGVAATDIEIKQTGDLEYYLVLHVGTAEYRIELDHVGTNRLADLLAQVNDR